jgi:hypothetical protein
MSQFVHVLPLFCLLVIITFFKLRHDGRLLPGRKLNIDAAPAMVGWDFSGSKIYLEKLFF